jgi:hypothetical protein
MEGYDREVNQHTVDINKTQGEYEDTFADLQQLKEEY